MFDGQGVLASSSDGDRGEKSQNLNPTTWAVDLISRICAKRDTVIILCEMWALWMMRNKRRHGEQPMSVQQAMLWACDMAYDLWQLNHSMKQRVKAQEAPRWSPPDPGWVKD